MNHLERIKRMFEYKAWANAELLLAMRLFDERTHATERNTAIQILNHTFVVDRIFAAHLRRLPHVYTATYTSETPGLEQLSADMRASDKWYIDYLTELDREELSEDIDFVFTDGDLGRMCRAEMLTHVIIHGAYHRGAVGRIMAQVSIISPRDVFAGYLHRAEPAARRRLS